MLRLPFFCRRPFFPSEVALVNVDGAGMVGVPGVAARLFDRFHKAGVAVKLIAQVCTVALRRAVAQTEQRSCLTTAQGRRRWSSRAAARELRRREGEEGPVDLDRTRAVVARLKRVVVVRKEREESDVAPPNESSEKVTPSRPAHRNSTQTVGLVRAVDHVRRPRGAVPCLPRWAARGRHTVVPQRRARR